MRSILLVLLCTAVACAPATGDGDTGDLTPEPEPDCLSGELGFGTEVGDCAQDFTLEDKDGVAWSLHEEAGNVILLDLSAFW